MNVPYSTPGDLEKDLTVFLDEQKQQNASEVMIYKNEFMLGTTMVAEFQRLLQARISEKAGREISLPQGLVRAGVVLKINELSRALLQIIEEGNK